MTAMLTRESKKNKVTIRVRLKAFNRIIMTTLAVKNLSKHAP